MFGDAGGEPRGVIFDLDGTLINTLGDITSSINQLLEEFDRPGVSAVLIRGMVGEGLPVLLQRVAGTDDGALIAAMVERFRPIYSARFLDTTELYPGIAAVLDALVARGMPLCVLSNKPDVSTKPICAALLKRWPFFQVLGVKEGVPHKPDPTAALALAEQMNRPPAEVFFVGDSSVDVRTAQAAGMTPVAVTWGFRDRPELVAAEPAYLVDDPVELMEVLMAGRTGS